MISKSASTGWSALKDSYHLQQARQNFAEPDYLNALAQAIQVVKPETSNLLPRRHAPSHHSG